MTLIHVFIENLLTSIALTFPVGAGRVERVLFVDSEGPVCVVGNMFPSTAS
jgi:hypothetical protein